MSQLFLSLGSNLGNRQENLVAAISAIEHTIGKVATVSSVYQSEPWGFESENWFLNQVIEVQTSRPLADLLKETQAIEKQLGRTKKTVANGYCDRIIDIDILAYDQTIFESEQLCVPHKSMTKRQFVLVPFCEIAPNWQHPILKKTVEKLLAECEDKKELTCCKSA